MYTRKLKTVMIALLSSLCCLPAIAQNLKIEQLAGDNCIIRISPDTKEKYLLLPIEESAPESQMKVITSPDPSKGGEPGNGSVVVRTLNIRLALTKVDYYVPFMLDEFRGKHLVFFTHVNIDRSNRGGVGTEVWLNNTKLSNEFSTQNVEKYRPEFHHTPEYCWMNDPNGMFYKDGVWHLYP